jgi:excisionase family DNA binding protein
MPIQHKFKKPVVAAQSITAACSPSKTVESVRQDVMTKEEVAEFLRVEPSTVYELTRKRSRHPLPFRRVGKYLRISRTEVSAGGMRQLESFGGSARIRT